jgi:hypothetical protein
MTSRKCDADNCPFEGDPEMERRKWHINRGIDLGHILVTVGMLAGFLIWALRQEQRLTTVENGLSREHDVNTAQDVERARQRDEIRSDLKTINEKLDRLVERR